MGKALAVIVDVKIAARESRDRRDDTRLVLAKVVIEVRGNRLKRGRIEEEI